MKRIGIMGGSFDPPHLGHLAMAECVRHALGLEQVLFIPTGDVAYKARDAAASGADRLAMTRLAVAGNPHFLVDAMEVERAGMSYTWETLEQLRARYPQTELVFIVGADSLDYMDRWREPARIFQACLVAAVNRPGISRERMEEKRQQLAAAFQARIQLIAMPPLDISSTLLRQRIRQGEPVRYFLPDGVLDYIAAQGLYTGPAGTEKRTAVYDGLEQD